MAHSVAERENLWNRNYLAVTSANFLLFFSFYLLLPILPLYLRDVYLADKHVIGIILSGYTITALLVRPFGGYIVDSFPRKQVLLICYFMFFALFAGYMVAGTLMLFAIIRGLHGFSFGAVTVANSTVAIDVMPASRRAEGIGYYGVSNNMAMAVGPSLSMYMYDSGIDAAYIFLVALVVSGVGLALNSTLRMKRRVPVDSKEPISCDRFFLVGSIPESLMVVFFSFAYGILSTYLAIYAKDEVGIEGGSGLFFMLLATGLVAARIIAARWVRRGMLTQNIGMGMLISLLGYALFVCWREPVGFYLSAVVLGAGYGAMCPSFQTVFINMAPNSRRGTANSTYLTSWDVGAGAGILIGGFIAEHSSYHVAYETALAVGVVGAIIFFKHTARHFNRHKLR